jgi:hypothetical protein
MLAAVAELEFILLVAELDLVEYQLLDIMVAMVLMLALQDFLEVAVVVVLLL